MATKIFPYAVIYGGKLVPANTPIETEDKAATVRKVEAPEAEKTKRGAKKNDKAGIDRA